jgi:hypothetical protein
MMTLGTDEGCESLGPRLETDIGHHGADRFLDRPCIQAPRIHPFQPHHAGVVPEFGMQLFPPDIDGVEAACSALQEHLGEASCGSADIERDEALGVEAEGVERAASLSPPRETKGDPCASTMRRAPGSIIAPGFSARSPSTLTAPRRIRSAARERVRASPLSTKIRSSRIFL